MVKFLWPLLCQLVILNFFDGMKPESARTLQTLEPSTKAFAIFAMQFLRLEPTHDAVITKVHRVTGDPS